MACAKLIWVHYSNPARDTNALFLQVNMQSLEPGAGDFSPRFRTGSLPSLAWQVEPALAAVISERYGSPDTVS
jgi:hypothetical protein